MAKCDWGKLLNSNRFRITTKVSGDLRNEFERDYDRLVTSSAFRRMQDKAQVFPLKRSDYVRTRLTHSIEVERLGSSLARDIYRHKRSLFPSTATEAEIESLVGTACLVHDIGNPPFGHSGEKSIQLWFKDHLKMIDSLSPAQQQDFLKFEGNAQGLRIATKLQWLNDKYGLNFTFATLGVMMKYLADANGAGSEKQSRKKPGYFQSEKAVVQRVWSEIGTDGACRHPLAFLMEAADDLAYGAADIEDAVKKGVITVDDVRELLVKPMASKRLSEIANDTLKVNRQEPDSTTNAVQNFRIRVIGWMFREVVAEFLKRYDQIMNGVYDDQLLATSKAAGGWKRMKEVARKHVYTARSVVAMEATGDWVIRGLLDRFIPAVLQRAERSDAASPASKLWQLISPRFREIYKLESEDESRDPVYHGCLLVTDFICGMTDTYALSLYRQVHGIELTNE